MNLMTLSKEIGENLQGFFVFYKGEDKCPFVEGNPLSVMWRAEKDLLYSEKVFDEWIVGNLIILRYAPGNSPCFSWEMKGRGFFGF